MHKPVKKLCVCLNRLTGGQAYYLHTGSMAPACPAHSLVLVRRRPWHIRPGMVVLYRTPAMDAPVLHRVVGVCAGGRMLRLKGDANALPDAGLVPREWVIGRLFLCLR